MQDGLQAYGSETVSRGATALWNMATGRKTAKITIQIQFSTVADPWKLEVSNTDTIGDVKQQIFEKHKLSSNEQILSFGAPDAIEFTTDTDTLEKCGIKHHDTLLLKLKKMNRTMTIYVKYRQGAAVPVDAHAHTSLNEVRARIFDQDVKLRPTQAEDALEYDYTSSLKVLNINNKDTIYADSDTAKVDIPRAPALDVADGGAAGGAVVDAVVGGGDIDVRDPAIGVVGAGDDDLQNLAALADEVRRPPSPRDEIQLVGGEGNNDVPRDDAGGAEAERADGGIVAVEAGGGVEDSEDDAGGDENPADEPVKKGLLALADMMKEEKRPPISDEENLAGTRAQPLKQPVEEENLEAGARGHDDRRRRKEDPKNGAATREEKPVEDDDNAKLKALLDTVGLADQKDAKSEKSRRSSGARSHKNEFHTKMEAVNALHEQKEIYDIKIRDLKLNFRQQVEGSQDKIRGLLGIKTAEWTTSEMDDVDHKYAIISKHIKQMRTQLRDSEAFADNLHQLFFDDGVVEVTDAIHAKLLASAKDLCNDFIETVSVLEKGNTDPGTHLAQAVFKIKKEAADQKAAFDKLTHDFRDAQAAVLEKNANVASLEEANAKLLAIDTAGVDTTKANLQTAQREIVERQRNIDHQITQIDALKNEVHDVRGDMAVLKTRVTVLTSSLADEQKKYADNNKKHIDELRKNLATIKDLNGEIETLKSSQIDHDALKRANADQVTQLQRADAKIATDKALLEKQKTDLQGFENQAKDAVVYIEKLKKELDRAQTLAQRHADQNKTDAGAIQGHLLRIQQLEGELRTAKAPRQDDTAEIKKRDATIAQKDGEIRQLSARVQDRDTMIDKLNHQIVAKDADIKRLTTENSQLRQPRAASNSNVMITRPTTPPKPRDQSGPPRRANQSHYSEAGANVAHRGSAEQSQGRGSRYPVRDDAYNSDDDFQSADEVYDDHHQAHGTTGQRDLAALHFMHLLARLRVLTRGGEDDFIADLVSVFENHIRDPNDIRALLQKLPARIVADHDNDFHDCLYHYLLSDDEVTPISRGHTARPHASV